MIKLATFCILTVVLPSVFGQTTSSSNDTSTNSVDDIYSLDEEDFKLWIAGRTPKAWESTTRRTSTTTQSTTDDTRLLNEFNSIDSTTETDSELSITPRPTLSTTPNTLESSETEGYFYPRPGNLQDWLHSHMLQSHQINNQLMADVSALSYPPRYVGSVPDCVSTSQAYNFRPASASFQTLATIHRFHDNMPPQQLPFPGSSHHGDAFLSQNQNQQKPQQQQQAQPDSTQSNQQPQPPVRRVTELHGNPLFLHRPQVSYVHATAETPSLVYGFY